MSLSHISRIVCTFFLQVLSEAKNINMQHHQSASKRRCLRSCTLDQQTCELLKEQTQTSLRAGTETSKLRQQ